MIITGIGARDVPEDICELFEEIGREVRDRGWWLRSGHASGSDYAFEKGSQDRCIVYLPWKTFNKQLPILGVPRTSELRDEVLDYVYRHDQYADDSLSDGVKLIKSRNVYQVLGEDLKSPSDLVVCWTEDGVVRGGTGLAIRIAREYNIPIVNVGNPDTSRNLNNIMQEILA